MSCETCPEPATVQFARGEFCEDCYQLQLALRIRELTDAMEGVPWSHVPKVGSETAATFCRRLEEAAGDLERSDQNAKVVAGP